MKAVRLLEYGGQLVFDNVPTPAIARDEILVKYLYTRCTWVASTICLGMDIVRDTENAMVQRTLSLATLLLSLLLVGCGREGQTSSSSTTPNGSKSTGVVLTMVAGSENESLKPILDRFASERGAQINVTFKGSVDTMLALTDAESDVDVVWPAASIWIDLANARTRVKYSESIMRSPVVFAVKKPVAERLGWVGKDVTVADILAAAEAGRLRYMMTSATQSNSGAAAYLGYLYSFAGSPDALTTEHLKDSAVTGKIRRLLGTVNRSAGSSGWLKDLFLQKYDQFDGMVNYESMIIEANRELTQRGEAPLYAIYPVDGLAIADHPLAYVDRGDAAKEALFRDLQKYLLSPEVQRSILQSGRRVGLSAFDTSKVDTTVFNPAWGIDLKRILTPIRWPSSDVIREALTLYQTSLRKPSLTVYCLDYSGSMREAGEDDLKGSMRILLDGAAAARYLLQTSARDMTIVIPFNDAPIDEWKIEGNDSGQMADLLARINSLAADGGTDIFTPVLRARDRIRGMPGLEGYSSAIILMTDGKSEDGLSQEEFQRRWSAASGAIDIPVYSIKFGKADDRQLEEIARLTSGRVFDGSKDLVRAFRQARGYN